MRDVIAGNGIGSGSLRMLAIFFSLGLTALLVSASLNVWCLRQPYPTVPAANIPKYHRRSLMATVFLVAGLALLAAGMCFGGMA